MDTCFVQDSNVVTRCIAGETIIVPVTNSVGNLDAIYTLNELGTMIWQSLTGETSVLQIVDAIVREFDVSSDQAAHDALEFLADLRNIGLIHNIAPGDKG